jgi:hypothetical protein
VSFRFFYLSITLRQAWRPLFLPWFVAFRIMKLKFCSQATKDALTRTSSRMSFWSPICPQVRTVIAVAISCVTGADLNQALKPFRDTVKKLETEGILALDARLETSVRYTGSLAMVQTDQIAVCTCLHSVVTQWLSGTSILWHPWLHGHETVPLLLCVQG